MAQQPRLSQIVKQMAAPRVWAPELRRKMEFTVAADALLWSLHAGTHDLAQLDEFLSHLQATRHDIDACVTEEIIEAEARVARCCKALSEQGENHTRRRRFLAAKTELRTTRRLLTRLSPSRRVAAVDPNPAARLRIDLTDFSTEAELYPGLLIAMEADAREIVHALRGDNNSNVRPASPAF